MSTSTRTSYTKSTQHSKPKTPSKVVWTVVGLYVSLSNGDLIWTNKANESGTHLFKFSSYLKVGVISKSHIAVPLNDISKTDSHSFFILFLSMSCWNLKLQNKGVFYSMR